MSKTTSFGYDLNGNTVIKTLGNGLLEKRIHDARNRVSSLNNEHSVGSPLAGYGYAYDLEGNVCQITESYAAGSLALAGRTITNNYDGVYRLLSEGIATSGGGTVSKVYTYDKGNNRTSEVVSGGSGAGTTTYLIGNGNNGAGANQIKSITPPIGSGTIFTYDLNGNRLQGSSGGHTDVYSYDYENRLVSLNYQTGSSGIGTYSYGYDYRTRRVTRAEPSAAITKITFMGGVSVEEYTSSASSPVVEYIRGHDYGGGVGGLEYCERSRHPAYNFYNSRGDVVTQTNSAAAVTFEAGYDAFGAILVQTGSTPDRQKANTKEQDPTGLLNEGFRYRDLETGTFITRDPLGFTDGPNLYTYVHQNPWTHFDPEGLEDNDKKHDPPPPPPKEQEKATASANPLKSSPDKSAKATTKSTPSNNEQEEPQRATVPDAIARTAHDMIGVSTKQIHGYNTGNGNLGCAAAVSMMYKQAVGQDILPGKPIVISTITLYQGLSNDSRFLKVPLSGAQSGDIVVTMTGKHPGHTGIVVENGNIISNSSSGFVGSKTDPSKAGTIQPNYTVKEWQKRITPRNPDHTSAFRLLSE